MVKKLVDQILQVCLDIKMSNKVDSNCENENPDMLEDDQNLYKI